eukprot:6478852-Amphidinium_carterae.1
MSDVPDMVITRIACQDAVEDDPALRAIWTGVLSLDPDCQTEELTELFEMYTAAVKSLFDHENHRTTATPSQSCFQVVVLNGPPCCTKDLCAISSYSPTTRVYVARLGPEDTESAGQLGRHGRHEDHWIVTWGKVLSQWLFGLGLQVVPFTSTFYGPRQTAYILSDEDDASRWRCAVGTYARIDVPQ